MQHVTKSMKDSEMIVSGDVLMLLFGFFLSESYALRHPTPSLLLDTMFYMKEQDMVDIDEWLGIPWEWMLHMKRVLKTSSHSSVIKAMDEPVRDANVTILDQHYDEGRPMIQAVIPNRFIKITLQISIDAELKWNLMMNNIKK